MKSIILSHEYTDFGFTHNYKQYFFPSHFDMAEIMSTFKLKAKWEADLLNVYHVPDTILDVGNTTENKKEISLWSYCSLYRRRNWHQTGIQSRYNVSGYAAKKNVQEKQMDIAVYVCLCMFRGKWQRERIQRSLLAVPHVCNTLMQHCWMVACSVSLWC